MKQILPHIFVGIATFLVLAWSGQAHDDKPVVPDASAPGSNSSPNRAGPGGASLGARIASLEAKSRQGNADAATWVELGDALMQKSRDSLNPRDYARAEKAYEQALQVEPRNPQALLGMAWVHNTEHDFDAGRRFAQAALEIEPKLPEAHALLGDAALELGEYDTAFEQYQEALDLRPDLASYSRAAHLLWLTGNVVKARWLMQKAIAAGGPYAENTAWCRAQLALMSFRNGALLPAERQAEQALRQSPNNPHALAVMATIKTARKEYDSAIDYYQRALAITASHDTLVALGDLYALLGRREEAERQYERVVALHTSGTPHSHDGNAHVHPRDPGSIQLARFYADHDRNLQDAVREAEMAFRTYKNIHAADTLAWCYYKNGMHDQARKTIAKALKWNTPDASILFHAGMIYSKAGDHGAARKYLYRALNLNPHFHPLNSTVAVDTLKQLAATARPAAVTQEAP